MQQHWEGWLRLKALAMERGKLLFQLLLPFIATLPSSAHPGRRSVRGMLHFPLGLQCLLSEQLFVALLG